MPKYIISGYVTCSVVAMVEADNEAQAKELADDLGTPSVHTNHHPDLADGQWHFNEFDDPPEDAVMGVDVIGDTADAEKVETD